MGLVSIKKMVLLHIILTIYLENITFNKKEERKTMKVTTSGFVVFVVLLQEARTEVAGQTETMYFCNANLINLCTSFLST